MWQEQQRGVKLDLFPKRASENLSSTPSPDQNTAAANTMRSNSPVLKGDLELCQHMSAQQKKRWEGRAQEKEGVCSETEQQPGRREWQVGSRRGRVRGRGR